ncbi:MBL fold metallo-hydrolase [bacterium]|nr:MBL fold metallo-hydrolase [bacterium]
MKKKVLLWILILIGLLILAASLFFLNLRMGMKSMSPVPTGRVAEGVYAIQDDGVNCFVIRGDSGLVMIDTGTNPDHVRKEFESLGMNPKQVKAVFLTHSDWDHANGAPLFAHAPLYISSAELPLLTGKKSRFAFLKAPFKYAYRTFEPNASFEIGGMFIQTIPAPGHTPGSTCFLVNDVYLFTGDLLSLKTGRVGLFFKTFNMDSDREEESIRDLASKIQNVRILFSAHYGYTDRVKEAFAGYMENDR